MRLSFVLAIVVALLSGCAETTASSGFELRQESKFDIDSPSDVCQCERCQEYELRIFGERLKKSACSHPQLVVDAEAIEFGIGVQSKPGTVFVHLFPAPEKHQEILKLAKEDTSAWFLVMVGERPVAEESAAVLIYPFVNLRFGSVEEARRMLKAVGQPPVVLEGTPEVYRRLAQVVYEGDRSELERLAASGSGRVEP